MQNVPRWRGKKDLRRRFRIWSRCEFLENLQDLRGGKSCLSWRLCCRQEVAVVMRRKTTWVRLNKRKSKDAERNASGKVMRSGYTEFLAMK